MNSRWQHMIRAAVARAVCERTGWAMPTPNVGDFAAYMRASAEHQRRIAAWLREHPGEALELEDAAAEQVAAEHDRRVDERRAAWEADRLDREMRALHGFLLSAGAGERTAEAVCRSLDDTEPMRAARNWARHGSGVLLLLGTRGTGKTVAAAWAMAELAATRDEVCLCDECMGTEPRPGCLVGRGHKARIIRPIWWPNRAAFVKAGHLASALHRPDDEGMWKRARSCRVVVIDDLGREYADQHGRWHAELDLLIDDRHEARLATIVTTNLTAAEFRTRYGERIADRIRQDGMVVTCTGESLRIRRTA